MILIADSGSTKTEWALLPGTATFKTKGISPYFLSTEQIVLLLQQELLPQILAPENITQIYYYGTGCTAPATVSTVCNALAVLFPLAVIKITYDLVASAHALCGNEKGIVSILGTGSNSCYYNGKEIERNNPGLGYILGDEGSGAYLGKTIIAEYLYGKLSKDLEQAFEEKFDIDKHSLLEKVYASTLPNRFLASFSIFFAAHRGEIQLERLLQEVLTLFFSKHILIYDQSVSVPIHFTGSIAWAYQDVLMELCKIHKLKMGRIVKAPIKELMKYYRNKEFRDDV